MAAKKKKAATEDAADGDAAPPAKAKGLKGLLTRKTIIIAAGAVVLLGGAGFGGYKFMAKKPAEKPVEVVQKPAVFVDMPDVLVNLSNAGGERTQYLKVKIVLELPDQALVGKIQPLMPRLTDAFQTYLRELRPTDLDGSAGLYRLKEELTRRVNVAVEPNHVTAVLFKEIVVQ